MMRFDDPFEPLDKEVEYIALAKGVSSKETKKELDELKGGHAIPIIGYDGLYCNGKVYQIPEKISWKDRVMNFIKNLLKWGIK